eukprot:7084096-Karenia_brevis.AAC.1
MEHDFVMPKGRLKRQRQRLRKDQTALRRVTENAVKAALFSFGRNDARIGGRGPQWCCLKCSWHNDMQRILCRR